MSLAVSLAERRAYYLALQRGQMAAGDEPVLGETNIKGAKIIRRIAQTGHLAADVFLLRGASEVVGLLKEVVCEDNIERQAALCAGLGEASIEDCVLIAEERRTGGKAGRDGAVEKHAGTFGTVDTEALQAMVGIEEAEAVAIGKGDA